MIKRFNPDFSLSISHELAYMRETPEGGYVAHGDYATLFSELEVVKAERDALSERVERLSSMLTESRHATKAAVERADALAVENAAKNDILNWNLETGMSASARAFHVGCDAKGCLHDAVQAMLIHFHTPATDAALAAVRAQERADLISVFNQQIKNTGLNDEALVTVLECREALKHAVELREAK